MPLLSKGSGANEYRDGFGRKAIQWSDGVLTFLSRLNVNFNSQIKLLFVLDATVFSNLR